MALGSLGVAYAMWFDTVTISGPVSTGSLQWIFTGPDDQISDDPAPGGPPYTGVPAIFIDNTITTGNWLTYANGTKNVGWTDVVRVDDHNVSVTLNNVYPSYAVTVQTHAYNAGTVPVKLHEVQLTYFAADGLTLITVPAPDGVNVYIWGWSQYNTYEPVLELLWVNNTGAQKEPGQIAEDSFKIHVLQAAQQDAQYGFTISRQADQWNEFTPP